MAYKIVTTICYSLAFDNFGKIDFKRSPVGGGGETVVAFVGSMLTAVSVSFWPIAIATSRDKIVPGFIT